MVDYKERFKHQRNSDKIRELWNVVRNKERTRITHDDECIFHEAYKAANGGHTSILLAIVEGDPDLSKLEFEV